MSEKFFFKLEDMHDTAETWTAPFWGPHLGEKEQEGDGSNSMSHLDSPQSLVRVRKTGHYKENSTGKTRILCIDRDLPCDENEHSVKAMQELPGVCGTWFCFKRKHSSQDRPRMPSLVTGPYAFT